MSCLTISSILDINSKLLVFALHPKLCGWRGCVQNETFFYRNFALSAENEKKNVVSFVTELNCGAFVSEVELFVFKLFPIFKHDSRSDWSVMYSDENGKCTKGKVGFVTIRWQIVFKTRDESIQRQVLHKKPIYSTVSFSFRDDVKVVFKRFSRLFSCYAVVSWPASFS